MKHLLAVIMKIDWQYTGTSPQKVKTFLKGEGVSRRLLATLKYRGGRLLVNDNEQWAIDFIQQNDKVSIVLPAEKNKNELKKSFVPIDIAFEDRDFLILNKPAHVASIPSFLHPEDTLINRVAGYYDNRHLEEFVPHIATRLDRDTSGLVLFAKHRFAHALLDQQLQNHQINKFYTAFVEGKLTDDHGLIDEPIQRDPESFIKRQVGHGEGSQVASTEYWLERSTQDASQYRIQLHTGRTHQIRVHFASTGHPLVGDTLYGGHVDMPMERQALHCSEIEFYQPFTHRMVNVQSPIALDMQKFINKNK
ncbi:RluA family pseudouridine synthase [Dellaglioa algida]|uniref:Pseudouridine synthase n=1 Tax=Dellaglioa algida TaxID=105612 RepID=A0A2C8ET05_9LACO|nr:pseudouridine synthase [Dellaglioa algida]SOB51818.1 Pseudouridine synthase [Dellaglioa algida]